MPHEFFGVLRQGVYHYPTLMNTRIHRSLLRSTAVIGLLILLAGCSQSAAYSESAGQPTEEAELPDFSAAAPIPTSPQDETVFVESDIELEWDWPPALQENQSFAVQLWYEDEYVQEVWTQDTHVNAADLIDVYARATGQFYWQVAVINVSTERGYEGVASEWSPVRTLIRVRHISPTPVPAEQQSDLVREISSRGLSGSELIDYARHFIHENSQGSIQVSSDPSFSGALELMYAHSQGRGEAPRLQCAARATAMLTLLAELGIDSRLIFLYGYGDSANDIAEHTILEAFNPETQQWELHDPTGDWFYVDVDTGERLSVERVLFGPLDGVTICGYDGECDEARFQEAFGSLFRAIRYGYTSTFWVNPDRFDLSHRFPGEGNANLAEYLSGNPREFTFILDSWENDEEP